VLAAGRDPPFGEDAMKLRISGLLAIAAFVVGCLLGSTQSLAQDAYNTNFGGTSGNTVSVISTATNTVIGSPITVGTGPLGVAVTPDGSKVYVTSNFLDRQPNLSVIDTATNAVSTTITGIDRPVGVAVTPDGRKVYVADEVANSVAVIDTATNAVTATIPVGSNPLGVAVNPDGSKVYTTNSGNIFAAGTVSVIDTATNTMIGSPITVGTIPFGVAVTRDGSKVYVANEDDNTVSVIDTTKNTVIATIPVGSNPVALGIFIQPPPRFAGTPGYSSCYGQSVSALGWAVWRAQWRCRSLGVLQRQGAAKCHPDVLRRVEAASLTHEILCQAEIA
jgi:YVTN family beta-propeller protein